MNSSFTEHILERARQRQRKIEELNTSENIPSRKKEIVFPKYDVTSDNDDTSTGTVTSTPDKKVARISSTKEMIETSRKSPMKISSHLPGSPQTQIKTLNIQKENFNMEIKLVSTDDVKVEVEIQDEESDKGNDKEGDSSGNISESGLREHARYKLKKLGKLYADGENANISSPIHNSEAYFPINQNDTSNPNNNKVSNDIISKKGLSKLADLTQNSNDSKSKRGLSKLADLAQNRREWDDETKIVKPDEPQKIATSTKSIVTSYNKKATTKSPSKNADPKSLTKKVEWDEGVLKALEFQGFTRTESNSRLVYNCSSPKKTNPKTTDQERIDINAEKPTKRSIEGKMPSGIESKKALFEKSSPVKQLRSDTNTKDPSMLSIADRKALFEKNKGEALIPKAAFAMSVPMQTKDKKDISKIKDCAESKFPKAVREKINATEKKYSTDKENIDKGVIKKTDRGKIASKIEALIENQTVEKCTSNSMTTQQEIEFLRNRFNKNKDLNDDMGQNQSKGSNKIQWNTGNNNFLTTTENIPETPKQDQEEIRRVSDRRRSRRKSDSPQVTSVLESVKNIKILQPKQGRLYPTLSDIEAATENENEQHSSSENSFNESFEMSDMGNTSFGREILEVVCKGQTPRKRSIEEASSDSNVSDILEDLDDCLVTNKSDCSDGPTPPKKANSSMNNSGVKQCNSFHYKSFTTETKSPTKILTSPKTFKSPRKSTELPTHVVDGENIMPLKHTVSFYRRQQMQINTPAKKVLHQPAISENDEIGGELEIEDAVAEKIKFLAEEINKQQMIISQTSQALNLCNCTLEFMGSVEQVEAEKLLLLASHRRQAALHEIQRLKIQGTLRPQDQHARNLPLEKGSLTIKNIKLPLKREYMRALAAAGGKGHHVICLAKSGEQVVSSQLVSTVATSSNNPDNDLVLPGIVKLDNIYSDFAVTFEVYCLQAQEEILPHEVKYHINKKASNKLTPRKAKQDSRMIVPPKESPAGPQAVRSSSFALMGYVVFSIQTINKTHFSLNNAPSMSPLEGRVDMNISCELAVSSEYRGFLTMFEDVSGFGAWHRRWCVLRGDTLSYWKYPDHEKEKAAIGSISLKKCITENVGPVSREVCARLNTFLIEIMREPEVGDKESLTLYHKSNKTIIRHLLSADTKEERIQWCEAFNKALIAIRMWGKK